MRRSEVMRLLAKVRDGCPAVTGPGATAGALWAAGQEPATIYNMEMGYATAVCLGVALAAPERRVVALEGEGSAIAGMPVLATIARYRPPNLVVIVFDNGVYGTGPGTAETGTRWGTDLAAVARGCGLDADRVVTVAEPAEAEAAIGRAFSEPGPWFILARIDRSDASGSRPRPEIDADEAAIAFRREMTRHPEVPR